MRNIYFNRSTPIQKGCYGTSTAPRPDGLDAQQLAACFSGTLCNDYNWLGLDSPQCPIAFSLSIHGFGIYYCAHAGLYFLGRTSSLANIGWRATYYGRCSFRIHKLRGL